MGWRHLRPPFSLPSDDLKEVGPIVRPDDSVILTRLPHPLSRSRPRPLEDDPYGPVHLMAQLAQRADADPAPEVCRQTDAGSDAPHVQELVADVEKNRALVAQPGEIHVPHRLEGDEVHRDSIRAERIDDEQVEHARLVLKQQPTVAELHLTSARASVRYVKSSGFCAIC